MSQAGEYVTVKFSNADRAAIEDWRRRQDAIPKLSESIRTLVRRGLAAEQKECND